MTSTTLQGLYILNSLLSLINWSNIVDYLITFLLGLITAYLVYKLNSKYKEKKVLLVQCRLMVSTDPNIFPYVSEFISIKAVNNHHRPITIVESGIALTNKRKFTQFTQLKSSAGENHLPIKLEDGDFVATDFDFSETAKTLRLYKTLAKNAYVKDSTGKEYVAPIPKNVNDRLRYITIVHP